MPMPAENSVARALAGAPRLTVTGPLAVISATYNVPRDSTLAT